MKTVIILRGTSNCGKSTFAKFLSDLKEDAVVCCADDYFYKSGEYKFDANKLGEAHNECKNKFLNALDQDKDLIVVANTNTNWNKEGEFYQKFAQCKNYLVFSVLLEKRHDKTNNHGCPDFTIKKQEENLRNSLKLS